MGLRVTVNSKQIIDEAQAQVRHDVQGCCAFICYHITFVCCMMLKNIMILIKNERVEYEIPWHTTPSLRGVLCHCMLPYILCYSI